MSRTVLTRLLRQLALIPIVALASYALMAILPLPAGEDTKREISSEVLEAHRRDLGIGEPLGFLRPWEKLFGGERLGTSAQGVTGEEMLAKLSGSVIVGLLALLFSLVGATVIAALRVRAGRSAAGAFTELLPALAFGTPVFLLALLLAPTVVERGHFLPELTAALVLSVWPSAFLGRILSEAVTGELGREYVRTARSKGVSRTQVLLRHVSPNVLPPLLDAIGPIATALLAGSFAAERVLGLPYFGQLYVLAVLQRQVAVVVVATTVFASLVVIVGVFVELLRWLTDPRSREAAT